jgi:hypothetical protein
MQGSEQVLADFFTGDFSMMSTIVIRIGDLISAPHRAAARPGGAGACDLRAPLAARREAP